MRGNEGPDTVRADGSRLGSPSPDPRGGRLRGAGASHVLLVPRAPASREPGRSRPDRSGAGTRAPGGVHATDRRRQQGRRPGRRPDPGGRWRDRVVPPGLGPGVRGGLRLRGSDDVDPGPGGRTPLARDPARLPGRGAPPDPPGTPLSGPRCGSPSTEPGLPEREAALLLHGGGGPGASPSPASSCRWS